MQKPDTITVVVSRREEVRAHRADIYFSAKGSILITADAALKKTKEVAQVLHQLAAIGVAEEHIILRGVQGERNTPIIGSANTASYLLRVHCPDLEKLPELLGTLTVQRNVVLDQLVWHFPDDAAAQARWLGACLAESREKAQQIAAAMGVKLLGVHSLVEKWTDPADEQKRFLFSAARAASTGKTANERLPELHFPLITTKQVEVRVEVDFRVSAYD
ncbi:MAG: hypothetical protein JWR69_1735 [Pedosphaera sp.]|nr:hypothetical protein [Pedosphaera sp.]